VAVKESAVDLLLAYVNDISKTPLTNLILSQFHYERGILTGVKTTADNPDFLHYLHSISVAQSYKQFVTNTIKIGMKDIF
jgi:hypothetical protein